MIATPRGMLSESPAFAKSTGPGGEIVVSAVVSVRALRPQRRLEFALRVVDVGSGGAAAGRRLPGALAAWGSQVSGVWFRQHCVLSNTTTEPCAACQ